MKPSTRPLSLLASIPLALALGACETDFHSVGCGSGSKGYTATTDAPAKPVTAGKTWSPEPPKQPATPPVAAPAAKPSAPAPAAHGAQRSARYDKPGYVTYLADGRLWIFAEGADAEQDFLKHGEPGKCATLIGAGPEGMTLKSDATEVIQAYLLTVPGFRTFLVDGRLWVFDDNSPDLVEFLRTGEPAKRDTQVGGGPNGMTLIAPDRDVAHRYMDALQR